MHKECTRRPFPLAAAACNRTALAAPLKQPTRRLIRLAAAAGSRATLAAVSHKARTRRPILPARAAGGRTALAAPLKEHTLRLFRLAEADACRTALAASPKEWMRRLIPLALAAGCGAILASCSQAPDSATDGGNPADDVILDSMPDAAANDGTADSAPADAAANDATPDSAPAAAALDAAITELEQAVAAAEREVERLRDVEALENLSGVYGHYVDKSMHDDVADLFAADGIVEILGRGVFYGHERVREYMHNLSPIGPAEGRLFNHMHLQPIVHVADDGLSANVRSRLFVMFSIHETNAQWGAGIYENEFVKEDGVWKIDYLHGYQTFYTLYEDGWAERSSGIFAPFDRLPPDGPQSVPYDPYPAAFVPPFHYPNPVSGRMDHYGRPRPPAPPR